MLERVRGARGERENFFSREKKFSRFPRITYPYREQRDFLIPAPKVKEMHNKITMKMSISQAENSFFFGRIGKKAASEFPGYTFAGKSALRHIETVSFSVNCNIYHLGGLAGIGNGNF